MRRKDFLHRADTVALRVTGAIDVQALRKSLQQLVSRHESLRTRLDTVDGELRQLIDDAGEFPLQVLQTQAALDAEVTARWLFAKTAARRCDLATGPVFAVTLLSASEQEHFIVWSLHHLVTDGASLNILFRELWQVYSGLPVQRSSTPYSEYATWQQRTNADWQAKGEAYWRARLEYALPLEWPAPAASKFQRGLRAAKAALGAELSDALKALASRERAQLAVAVLTIYVAVAARWCGRTDFVVPFNIGSRDRPAYENTTGHFARPLFLRVTLSGAETFIDLMNTLGRELYQALLHQDFGRVALQAPHLWNTVIQWCSWDPAEAFGVPTPSEASGLGVRVELFEPDLQRLSHGPVMIEGPAAPWDMSLSFYDAREGICAYLGVHAELFSPESLARFADHLVLAARIFVTTPHARITCVPGATPIEAKRH